MVLWIEIKLKLRLENIRPYSSCSKPTSHHASCKTHQLSNTLRTQKTSAIKCKTNPFNRNNSSCLTPIPTLNITSPCYLTSSARITCQFHPPILQNSSGELHAKPISLSNTLCIQSLPTMIMAIDFRIAPYSWPRYINSICKPKNIKEI